MLPIPFSGTFPAASPADIEAVEAKYGFALPADYKAHLLANNGGRPDQRTFIQVTEDGRQVERDIRTFFSVRYGESTLESGLESLHSELHPDLVPFGDESGGDVFVLSVGPEDYGSVYYVAHEFYTPPFSDDDYDEETDTVKPLPPRQYGAGVHFLAPSFTAFLEGLEEGTVYEDDDDD